MTQFRPRKILTALTEAWLEFDESGQGFVLMMSRGGKRTSVLQIDERGIHRFDISCDEIDCKELGVAEDNGRIYDRGP